MEITVVYLYLLLRVDRRFHVPNGSKGPGDYSGQNEKGDRRDSSSRGSGVRIMSEEEVFDDASPIEHQPKDEEALPQQ